jgi:hypothetical protein
LYHISAVDSSKYEEILDVSLEFIWKSMHNSAIRIYLHHFKQAEDKMKVNDEVKNLLKMRRFKWKTLQNDVKTGHRIEVMEGANLEFKE